jgi:hypothetical protein
MNCKLFEAILKNKEASRLLFETLSKEVVAFTKDDRIPSSSRLLTWPRHHALFVKAMDHVVAMMPELDPDSRPSSEHERSDVSPILPTNKNL